MRVVYLVGGIASGKSSVAAELEGLGATRIDLDQLSREVLAPGSPLLPEITREFGEDLLTDGTLDRSLLAVRAFATPEDATRLEELELPAIKQMLVDQLDALRTQPEPPAVVVVEVPLPDRMGSLADLADETLCVSCPISLRRERAIGRGMTGEDFDRRAARQLTDDELASLADAIFDNSGDQTALVAQVHDWWVHNASHQPAHLYQ